MNWWGVLKDILGLGLQVSEYHNPIFVWLVTVALGVSAIRILFIAVRWCWTKFVPANSWLATLPVHLGSWLMNKYPVIVIAIIALLAAWQLGRLTAEQRQVNDVLSRYVLPRHLSEDQIGAIAEYLSSYDSQTFKIVSVKNSGEAAEYGADFQTALERGGWKIDGGPTFAQEDLPEGISIQFTETQVSYHTASDSKHPKTNALFIQALASAHIKAIESGDGSGPDVQTNTFTIRIGPRRMDDVDLIHKEQQKAWAHKILKDEDE